MILRRFGAGGESPPLEPAIQADRSRVDAAVSRGAAVVDEPERATAAKTTLVTALVITGAAAGHCVSAAPSDSACKVVETGACGTWPHRAGRAAGKVHNMMGQLPGDRDSIPHGGRRRVQHAGLFRSSDVR